MAEEEQIMTMQVWIDETDNLLKFRKKEILKDSGKISHKQAIEKAYNEVCPEIGESVLVYYKKDKPSKIKKLVRIK